MDLVKPGDVILYPVSARSALSSRLVAVLELLGGAGKGVEQYSHAALVSGRAGHQYEAKWPRTGHFRIDYKRPWEVWRCAHLTERQRERVLWWAQDHVGEFYNMIGLLTGGLLGFRRTAVCSQFVGQAYAYAGVHIAKEGKRILSPNAIADSSLFTKVYTRRP